jgi:hypothetical protein
VNGRFAFTTPGGGLESSNGEASADLSGCLQLARDILHTSPQLAAKEQRLSIIISNHIKYDTKSVNSPL